MGLPDVNVLFSELISDNSAYVPDAGNEATLIENHLKHFDRNE